MNLKELFNGIAIVIDDELQMANANINRIVEQMPMPMVKYIALPSLSDIKYYQNISFIILDWNLNGVTNEEQLAGVKLPSSLQEPSIEFIKELTQNIFCPIFIFTNESVNDIKKKLTEENLLIPNKPSNILIMQKQELYGSRSEVEKNNEITGSEEIKESSLLFEKLTDWLKQSPSVYVLKKWEKEYQEGRNKLFLEFHKINANWAKIMWKTFGEDQVNKSLEMRELIYRNIHSKIVPFDFFEAILNTGIKEISKDEIRAVLESERFHSKDNLYTKDIGTGDLFKISSEEASKEEYLLNIRAQCDLNRDENPKLYCITGHELSQKDNGKIEGISFSKGEYLEKSYQAIVAFIDGGKIVEFSFKDLEIKTWKDLENYRIGRLLPPYITKIQQRFSLYIQRQGLPKIPNEAIK